MLTFWVASGNWTSITTAPSIVLWWTGPAVGSSGGGGNPPSVAANAARGIGSGLGTISCPLGNGPGLYG